MFVRIFFLRSPLSLGDIHDGRYDNVPHAGGRGIEANLNGELASVFSRANQITARSHRTPLRGGSKFLSQATVASPKAHWN
jgi:hypothetical protein